VDQPFAAEGKTLFRVNPALAQSHLAESSVLLADFDLAASHHPHLFQNRPWLPARRTT